VRGQQASPAAPGSVVAHRFLLSLLHSPFGRLFGGLCELRFVGRLSGRTIALPIQCVREGLQLVIYVGHASGKRWWRNFTDGHDVLVHVSGASCQGHGRVVDAGHPDRAWAERTYRGRYPKLELLATDPIVIIDLAAGTSQEISRDRVKGE
jgi:hypothetical protein